jgi:hypothetical protein
MLARCWPNGPQSGHGGAYMWPLLIFYNVSAGQCTCIDRSLWLHAGPMFTQWATVAPT